MRYDIVIRNGTVIDGTGAAGKQRAVAIRAGRIAEVGELPDAVAADVVIDATGMVVCPGFIDAHNHAHVDVDKDILHEDNLVRQGITTLVAGNCGRSGWPVGEHLDKVDRLGMKQNYAMLAGHNTLRRALLGDNQAQFLDPWQIRAFQKLVDQAMEEGAFGVAAGYMRPYATNDELFAFARAAGRRGGLYASHIRSEDRHLLQAIAEIIELAQHAEAPVQISHLKTMNEPNWNKLDSVFHLIDDAVARGLRVCADRYPYTAWHGGSTNALPPIAYQIKQQRGSWQNLYDPDVVEVVREEVDAFWAEQGGPESLLFCSMKGDPMPEVENKTPGQLARAWNCDLLAVGIRLEEIGGISAIGRAMSEDNLKRILAHPLVCVGTDGHQEANKGVQTHPRNYGTFPRILGKYVRDEKVLDLPQAIRKMSAMVAAQFGFNDRGLLKPGLAADVVVFDPLQVRDKAEFGNAHQYPDGIPQVIVNGRFAVRDGVTTPENHGRALRKA